MFEFLSGSELTAFGSVIIIDIVMSGDNAVIIGMAAAGLPLALRRRAIIYGIMAAAVLRIIFASITVQLLAILGLGAGAARATITVEAATRAIRQGARRLTREFLTEQAVQQ